MLTQHGNTTKLAFFRKNKERSKPGECQKGFTACSSPHSHGNTTWTGSDQEAITTWECEATPNSKLLLPTHTAWDSAQSHCPSEPSSGVANRKDRLKVAAEVGNLSEPNAPCLAFPHLCCLAAHPSIPACSRHGIQGPGRIGPPATRFFQEAAT